MEMMLDVLIWVLVMEVKKVADEMTNMEVDKVTNMMAEFRTNASGATWWPNFSIMQVAPLGGQISN